MQIIFCPLLWAGNFTAEVDKTQGTLDDSFDLTLTIEGRYDGEPKMPTVDGLDIQFSGKSTSASWVNGKFSKEERLSYVILPQKEGTFVIPGIQLKVDGKVLSTAEIQLQIRRAGANNPPPSAGTGSNSAQDRADDRPVFIERTLAKSEAYVGEQVIVTTRIFTRVQLAEASPENTPQAEFKRYSVEGESNYATTLGGIRYNVIELNEVWLPIKAGEITIKPYVLKTKIIAPSSRSPTRRGGSLLENFFADDFFGRRQMVQKTLRSNESSLRVKPLPSSGKPPKFSGAVGNFKLSANLQPTQIKASETATLTLTLEGQGVLSGIDHLDLGFDPALKVYADKPDEKTVIDSDLGIQSRKVFKYALVPTKAGSYPFPNVSVWTFDPAQNKYVELKQNVGELVASGNGEEGQTADPKPDENRAKQMQVKALSADLIGLHAGGNVFNQQVLTPYDRWLLGGICGLPLSILFCFFLFLHSRNQRQKNAQKIRQSRAFKNFKHVHRELTQPQRGQEHAYATKLSAALKTFMGDKLGVPGLALTAKEIEEKLKMLNVKSDLLAEVSGLLKNLSRIEYGDKKILSQDYLQLHAQMLSAVKEMDKYV